KYVRGPFCNSSAPQVRNEEHRYGNQKAADKRRNAESEPTQSESQWNPSQAALPCDEENGNDSSRKCKVVVFGRAAVTADKQKNYSREREESQCQSEQIWGDPHPGFAVSGRPVGLFFEDEKQQRRGGEIKTGDLTQD